MLVGNTRAQTIKTWYSLTATAITIDGKIDLYEEQPIRRIVGLIGMISAKPKFKPKKTL